MSTGKIKEMDSRKLTIKALTLLNEAASKDEDLFSIFMDFLEEVKPLYGIEDKEVLKKIDQLDSRRK